MKIFDLSKTVFRSAFALSLAILPLTLSACQPTGTDTGVDGTGTVTPAPGAPGTGTVTPGAPGTGTVTPGAPGTGTVTPGAPGTVTPTPTPGAPGAGTTTP